MNVGVIGLGKMGSAIATRIQGAGHTVIGYDPFLKEPIKNIFVTNSLQEIAQQEVIWLMIPSNIVNEILDKLIIHIHQNRSYGFDLLHPEYYRRITTSDYNKLHPDTSAKLSTKGCAHPDTSAELSTKGCAHPELVEGYERLQENKTPIIIDGGNSFYQDSQGRAIKFAQLGIHYIDCGTSGGINGIKNGFCLMIGGNEKGFKKAEPIFEAVATKNGYALVGSSGAGHYVKMIHNGIEYALLQSYAEGFNILHESKNFPELNLEQISGLWMNGSVIRSYLLQLTNDIFKEKIDFTPISGKIAEGGTGRWAEEEAKILNLAVPALESALKVRKESHQNNSSFTMKLISLLRNKFGGHPLI